ncbi:hypothetical protein BV898_12006 [Hypsibius exemplaris]|uniref:Uncharacterized protein n=1 Tax=Hypsibius exemplaris TaxID=2072580 RepID=A0A1W0WF41_HYPEX|nr:hypothetical protein BV898_12006 [Hypsibius exemplaris]
MTERVFRRKHNGLEEEPLLQNGGPPGGGSVRPPLIRVTPATRDTVSASSLTAADRPSFTTTVPSSAGPHRRDDPIPCGNVKYDLTSSSSMLEPDSPSSIAGLTAKDIYRLSSDGLINIDDPSWAASLQSAVFANEAEICEALLCCGVPMTAALLASVPVTYEEVKGLCTKFFPDMFTAVRMGNVKQVRCLVNLWHKVSLVREGKPLFQLAVEHANPYIISLIGGIQMTMEVAHLVLAGNTEKLKTIRNNGPFIRRTLKHFGHNCAPILYFAMIQNDCGLVTELCEHFGLKSDDEMLDQDGLEIPLLFAAMQDALDTKIIAVLLQHTNRRLPTVWYHQKNILQYAIDLQVSEEIFAVVLEHGGGQLLGERDLLNRSVMDLILVTERETNEPLNGHRIAVERQIKIWIRDSSVDAIWLAVMGFDFQSSAVQALDEIAVIQDRIASMDDCIGNDDVQWFEELLHEFESTTEKWPSLAWFGHPVGSGQTLLHRAVIQNRLDIVEVILTQADMSRVPLDNFGASALHYACASCEYEAIERVLLCAGFGDHTVDKFDHDTASYRMKRDSVDMLRYLAALADGDCAGAADLDPWLAVQPILTTCSSDTDLADLPYQKRILTVPDANERRHSSGSSHSSSNNNRKNSSTHSHGKGGTLGALPDSWCSLC